MRCPIPEGVEVKLSADVIRPLVVGKVVSGLAGAGRYRSSDPEGMAEFCRDSFNLFDHELPATVLDVKTKGKFMYWSFENDWYMFCTFGMTGQWSPKQGKHPSFTVYLSGDRSDPNNTMFFNDPRHFGTIKFIKGKRNLDKKLAELGWDPLNEDFDVSLISKIRSSPKPIGELLMNQKLFAGVGNYIRAESLYLSKTISLATGHHSVQAGDYNSMHVASKR